MSIHSVGIIYKYNFPPARKEAEALQKWLKDRGVTAVSEEMSKKGSPGASLETFQSIPADIELLIVLGGDGTLLGAARKVAKRGIPILGVNVGGLGFLTEIPVKRLYPAIEKMLEASLEVEARLMLETRVLRSGEEACRVLVLNDVVINKGALARIIDLDVYINEEFLTTFRADGLIVSTPTGSTAYNLSAGGPVLYPTMTSFILTPICPFTLTNRPIILPDSHRVSIKLPKETAGEKVSLTFDGQVGFDLLQGDEIIIRTSERKIKLVKSPDQTYFEILREKLMWGGATYSNKNGNNKANP
ncbi:MAG: NAD(+)/NADH kinase [Deltaproteobacteria bacterium]|nr:NAD(+)/NADH kinase [Deltaproteobacteria bacterium]MBW1936030.1 NAD(+)/NADH kinase [Deltaproteobacteria bacterium]MBW1978746.1 NAD(+)/NADH kinase [Deltaproteobacteria bacterium]MBW2045139.1 NAD(+)/NADH kinase [Deltaproteobacteria bacterium]MBW2300693.1 NAD(+)/NADH kinase [Deltaproteobacteria bacterium]